MVSFYRYFTVCITYQPPLVHPYSGNCSILISQLQIAHFMYKILLCLKMANSGLCWYVSTDVLEEPGAFFFKVDECE